MNMDLEEMKAAWQVIDRRLDQQNTLLLNEVRTGRVRQAKRALRPLRWGQGVQIIAGMALMFLFAPYWVAHINSFHVMLPGLFAAWLWAGDSNRGVPLLVSTQPRGP